MKNISLASAMAGCILASNFANAATTADLTLTGTITPPACTPVFSGGGIADYGNIAASTLSATTVNQLGTKNSSVTITCDSPAKFYYSFIDNKAASVNTDTMPTGSGTNTPFLYGLGTTSKGAKIGAYTLQLSGETSSTGKAMRIRTIDGTNWIGYGGYTVPGGVYRYSYGDNNTTTPGAFSSVTTNITITAAVDKTANLSIGNLTTLDGSATLNIFLL